MWFEWLTIWFLSVLKKEVTKKYSFILLYFSNIVAYYFCKKGQTNIWFILLKWEKITFVTLKYNKLKVFLNGLISISFIHFQDLRFISDMPMILNIVRNFIYRWFGIRKEEKKQLYDSLPILKRNEKKTKKLRRRKTSIKVNVLNKNNRSKICSSDILFFYKVL
jgi:hypothetical protein